MNPATTVTAEAKSNDAASKVRILCVDDEPAVLEGLTLTLRRRCIVQTAPGGVAGLEILQRDSSIAVIVSDMRMPGMDGAAFLARARQVAPDAVRILLTGQADLDSAISAVNEGRIYRFLTKPCGPATIQAAVEGAAEQHRLVTSERVLLEQTLHGSIKALTDVLALTNPASFGRANRLKQTIGALADQLAMRERWQVEVAAMLSQIGCIILPNETASKVCNGQPLTEREQSMVARMPAVTEQILASIPRLEIVRAMLALQGKPYRELQAATLGLHKELIVRGAQMLSVAADFDGLESSGSSAVVAIATLRGRGDHYDTAVLDALAAGKGKAGSRPEVREIPVTELRVGMVLADDLRLTGGTLIITRGFEVTGSFMERVRNFEPGTVREPVRVIVRS